MANYDWAKIKTYYIAHEDVSYEDLHAKFGVSSTAIKEYQQRYNEDWQELRKQSVRNATEKLPEKTGEKIAEFQAEKVKVGKVLIQEGLVGLKTHKPRTARESKELIEAGYGIATEGMGLDNPKTQVNLQQNNQYISVTDFIERVRKAEKERHGQPIGGTK